MRYYCNECKKTISEEVYRYSKTHFNRPLCMEHQKIARTENAPLTEADSRVYPKEPKQDTGYNNVVKAKEIAIQEQPTKSENVLVQWLLQWIADKPLNLSVESKHFFLSGMELEEFARDIIGRAQDEILVTSPYVDSCHLATALQRAVGRRVKVKVVARRPSNTKVDALKAECQSNLRSAGVVFHYINQIHSKIVVIDRKIAIISSMNLYSGSTGGATFEAGIVSFDKIVVDSAAKYIVDLLDKPESVDDSTSRYDWRARRY